MTGPDAEFEKRLLATFREEAEEHLGTIEALLLDLERAGPTADPSLIERTYRTTHSLKGAARAVSQKDIESICQNMENVFSRMKKGTYFPDAEAFDLFHRALNVLQCRIKGEALSGVSPVGIVAALRALIPKEPADKKVSLHEKERAAPANVPDLVQRSAEDVPSIAKPGCGAFDSPSAGTSGSGGTSQQKQESPASPQVSAVPLRENSDGGTVRIAAHKLDRLIAGSDDLLTTRLFITHRMRELDEMMGRFAVWRWNQTLMSSDLYLFRETITGARKSSLSAELVPPLERLIKFLDYNREFVMYLQHDLMTHIRATERDRSALEASTSEISDLIHNAVLQPVSSILISFPGLVRQYSRSTGKKVDLVTDGGEIEVDRRILDSLKDPLMHLIYNAIDHGIEYPDIRAAAAKPETGMVQIKVFPLSGGKVGIEVSDDGAGIDGRAIRKIAVKNGFLTPREEARLTDKEAVWLIFRSGFSMRQDVTEISGRGLGLAIVEDTVTRLGGSVTISTDAGRGTSIILRVPVRLVTFRGVIVRLKNRVYVLPMQQVRQVIRVRADSIIKKGNRPVVPFHNEMVSVIHLSELLGTPHPGIPPGDDIPVPLVIIAYGAGKAACIVDEVIRVQEIVVRPLGSQLIRVRKISGAAVLGDGTLALVLDTPDLIQEALRITGSPLPVTVSDPSSARILVVEDSVTSRTFLRMLLEKDGHQVLTALDGIQALGLLREEAFDIVVSDVDMPRMSGFTLTEKIRADRRLSRIPIVLVTSLDSPEDEKHGLAVGADAYVIKSGFEQNDLRTIVKNLLKKTGIRAGDTRKMHP